MRKYPCEAIYVGEAPDVPGLKGKTVTVLTDYKFWDCCCNEAHALELPDGFPTPPKGCDYWMAQPKYLEFLDKKED